MIHFFGQPLDAKEAVQEAATGSWELFELQKDPDEVNNAVDHPDHAEILVTLREQLIELQAQVGDTTPEIALRTE